MVTRPVLGAPKAMNAFTFRGRQCLGEKLKILTLNFGGLRSPYKKESLKVMAHHLKFNVGVMTETHMLKNETGGLVIPGYQIIAKAGTSEHRGGIRILVDKEVPYGTVKKAPKPQHQLTLAHCCYSQPAVRNM